jgi:hypothetical protein
MGGNWQVIGFCFLPAHLSIVTYYLFGFWKFQHVLVWVKYANMTVVEESVFVDRLFLVISVCPLLCPFVFGVCKFSSIFMFTSFPVLTSFGFSCEVLLRYQVLSTPTKRSQGRCTHRSSQILDCIALGVCQLILTGKVGKERL